MAAAIVGRETDARADAGKVVLNVATGACSPEAGRGCGGCSGLCPRRC